MTQRKRPGATAKKERKARVEARKNAPKDSRRQMLYSALDMSRRELAGLDEYSSKLEVARLELHIQRLQSQLAELGEE